MSYIVSPIQGQHIRYEVHRKTKNGSWVRVFSNAEKPSECFEYIDACTDSKQRRVIQRTESLALVVREVE